MQTNEPTGVPAQTPAPHGASASASEAGAATARHAADVRTYRRRRRTATVATVLVTAVVADFGTAAVAVLRAGGDTRFGIVPFLLAIATAVVGVPLLVALWRRALTARRATMPAPAPEPEPEPRPHLSLSGEVPPPVRW